MTNLTSALDQLRSERTKAQSQLEKLDQAISVIESLNGSVGSSSAGSRKTGAHRNVSAEARRKMSMAQRARWARVRNSSGKSVSSAPRKVLSLAARRKIAAAQRARWARVRAQQKAA